MADQPSKESLERAIKFKVHSDCYWDNACSRCIRIALEFDAIAKELRQQNAALVSALRELEQKWRIEAQGIREQIVKGKSSGCIMMATVIEWKEEAAKFDAHADEIKKILASYAPAETREIDEIAARTAEQLGAAKEK